MRLAYLLLLAVFVIALLANPTRGDGWFWEIGNGFGFVAIAILLMLTTNGRSGTGSSRLHRWMGFAALIAMLLHVLWLLLGDWVVIEYIKFTAPAYMVLGLLALILTALVTFSSLLSLRKSSYQGHGRFRRWHRYLSIVILVSSALHIGLSGYYLETILQWGLLIALCLLVFIYPINKQISTSSTPISSAVYLLLAAVVLIVSFAAIRNMGVQ